MSSPFDRVGGASSIATGEQIGSAGFSIYADAGSFFDTIDKARGAAERASKDIGKSFGKGGGAGMGLLQLGNAIDDVQYGFRGIVNNIPGIVMGFGGSMGIAGAVGIAAVAVNQLINHWDALKATFGDTQFIRDASAALTEFKGIPGSPQGKEAGLPAFGAFGLKMTRDTMEKMDRGQSELAEGRARDAAAGAKLFEKAGGETVDKQKAADFKAAIEESGGMKAVLDAALKEAMKTAGADEATQKGRIAKWFEAGSKGGNFNPDAFGKGFGKAYDAQDRRRMDKRDEDAEKEAADARKAATERKQQKELFDIDMQEKVLGKRRDAINEAEKNKPTLAIHGDWQSKIDSMTTERFNRVPTQQLDELKAIKKEMEKLNDKKDELRGAKFG